ncbi:hypothetical protein MHU86_11393 [Fragilaria crotonensis]|nr:hypothetical protein MHU86_11393 [Fragilaria crotonensis]
MQRWTLKSGPPTGGGGDNTAPSVELIPGSETLTRPPDSIIVGLCRTDSNWIFWEGRQVTSQTVEKAMRHVAQAFMLEGYPDPDAPLDPAEATWLCPLPTYLNPIKTETPSPTTSCLPLVPSKWPPPPA